jgi:hypothetical protein
VVAILRFEISLIHERSRLRALRAARAAAGVLLLIAPIAGARGARKAAAADAASSEPSPVERLALDNGFQELYRLNFEGARAQFHDYQVAEPADPLGKVAEAASYLYEEFDTKGVLTSEFFLDDDRFLGGVEGNAANNRNEAFLTANTAARAAAHERLETDPHDREALLAITMADGMESNYDAIIEKKQLAGLTYMRQAEDEARTLLAIDPSAQDAYVALGTSNYVIGSLSSVKRAVLWFGGIHGDKKRGMDQLQHAVDNGHYLQPFAKILLALVSEREKQDGRARALLSQLNEEFPENPIFARELKIADQRAGHTSENRP